VRAVEAVDERTEAHPLHDTSNYHLRSDGHSTRYSTSRLSTASPGSGADSISELAPSAMVPWRGPR
jgi:hypothetical protein